MILQSLFSVNVDEAIKTCTNILFQLSCDGTPKGSCRGNPDVLDRSMWLEKLVSLALSAIWITST